MTELDEMYENEEQRERFRVENDSQATWAMKKLREVTKKRDEQLKIGDEEIALIRKWQEDIEYRHQYQIQYFEGLLHDYARRQREEGVKTVTTPYGKVATRIAEFKVSCHNPDEFLAWAEASLPQVVRVKKEMSVSAIKELVKSGVLITDFDSQKLVSAEGEVIPAIVVQPPQVAVTISTEE